MYASRSGRLLSLRTRVGVKSLSPSVWARNSAIRWNSTDASFEQNNDEFKPFDTHEHFAVDTGSPEALQFMNEQLGSEPPALIDTVAELGYSPTDLILQGLDFIHTTSGLPWWATIVAVTAATRTLLFPMVVKSIKNAQQLKIAQPEMQELKNRYDSDPNFAMEYQQRTRQLMKKHGIKLGYSLAPFLQMPVFISFFFALERLGNHFPSAATGGALWFPDLTVADPTMALPAINAGIMVVSILASAKDMPQTEKTIMIRRFMLGVSGISFFLTRYFDSSVIIYWISSSTYSILQSSYMRIPAIRKHYGLLPVGALDEVPGKPDPSPFASPFQQAVMKQKGPAPKTYTHKPKKKKQV